MDTPQLISKPQSTKEEPHIYVRSGARWLLTARKSCKTAYKSTGGSSFPRRQEASTGGSSNIHQLSVPQPIEACKNKYNQHLYESLCKYGDQLLSKAQSEDIDLLYNQTQRLGRRIQQAAHNVQQVRISRKLFSGQSCFLLASIAHCPSLAQIDCHIFSSSDLEKLGVRDDVKPLQVAFDTYFGSGRFPRE